MTADDAQERVYIRSASEQLNRQIGTLRKWDTDNILPRKLRPKRGHRGWRYWTPEQIQGIREWIEKTERFPGKGLPSYQPDAEDAERQVLAMRKPRTN